jgi:cyclopropane fatty-acyl-phospholipid synthase-like methyltransferase
MSIPSPTLSEEAAHYYDEKVKKYGHSHKAVGWYSEYTQEIRFAALSMVGDLNEASVMDIGCGQGDFKSYCDDQGLEVDYYGCDISAEMIQVATDTHPKSHFIHSDYKKLNLTYSTDYIVASGLLSLKSHNPYDEFLEALSTFLKWCRKGVAINLLSELTADSQKHPELFNYFSPKRIIEITQEITPYIELNHRYLDNDMTILAFPN